MKNLKLFLNEAVKCGRLSFNPFARFGFKIPKAEIDAIALTEQELNELEHLDLSDNPSLSIIRDHFICMCYSGLRISDYVQLAKAESFGEQTPIMNIKTKEISYVPTLPPISRILSKHKNCLPKLFSEQYINREIKNIVARIPLFKEQELLKITYGSGAKPRYSPRFKLVSNHTARRTLITILLRQGFTPEEVMAITGHTSIRSIRLYNKMTKKELSLGIKNRFKDPGA